MTKITTPPVKETQEWEDKVKICNHDWVMRLIKFGQTKIPKLGFYIFYNPELEEIIRSELSRQRAKIVKEMGKKICSNCYGMKYIDMGMDGKVVCPICVGTGIAGTLTLSPRRLRGENEKSN